MKAELFVYTLPALILGTVHLADAQASTKVPRVGYLGATSRSINSAPHNQQTRVGTT
jgi:hypothetical protein